jgi:hypothetical protein
LDLDEVKDAFQLIADNPSIGECWQHEDAEHS